MIRSASYHHLRNSQVPLPQQQVSVSSGLRFSETDEEYEAIIKCAHGVFRHWDIVEEGAITQNRAENLFKANGDHKKIFSSGEVTVEEIEKSGMDKNFAAALARVLIFREGGSTIYVEDLIDCLNVLTHGTLEAKVALFFCFMDSSQTKAICFEDVEESKISFRNNK